MTVIEILAVVGLVLLLAMWAHVLFLVKKGSAPSTPERAHLCREVSPWK